MSGYTVDKLLTCAGGHRHLMMHIHSGPKPVPDQILDCTTTAMPIAEALVAMLDLCHDLDPS